MYQLTLTATGRETTDIVDALREAVRRIENDNIVGFDENMDSSFRFDIVDDDIPSLRLLCVPRRRKPEVGDFYYHAETGRIERVDLAALPHVASSMIRHLYVYDSGKEALPGDYVIRPVLSRAPLLRVETDVAVPYGARTVVATTDPRLKGVPRFTERFLDLWAERSRQLTVEEFSPLRLRLATTLD